MVKTSELNSFGSAEGEIQTTTKQEPREPNKTNWSFLFFFIAVIVVSIGPGCISVNTAVHSGIYFQNFV